MQKDSPAAELINHLGGYAVVANKLALADSTVAAWKSRKAIPRAKWPDLLQAFPDKVDIDRLIETERAA